MLPRVRDYMDTVVATLRADQNILDAVYLLLDKRVTGAPVVDDQNRLIGILTEKDLLRLLAEGVDAGPPKGTVGDYMAAKVMTVSPDMNIYFCAGLFLNDVVRRFPVVEHGKVVGAITRYDILRAIKANYPR
jgi:CBS domain-containing protein